MRCDDHRLEKGVVACSRPNNRRPAKQGTASHSWLSIDSSKALAWCLRGSIDRSMDRSVQSVNPAVDRSKKQDDASRQHPSEIRGEREREKRDRGRLRARPPAAAGRPSSPKHFQARRFVVVFVCPLPRPDPDPRVQGVHGIDILFAPHCSSVYETHLSNSIPPRRVQARPSRVKRCNGQRTHLVARCCPFPWWFNCTCLTPCWLLTAEDGCCGAILSRSILVVRWWAHFPHGTAPL